jgi:glycerol kinase
MQADLGRPLGRLRVDGGAAANDLLMQMQSDFSAISVERPTELESTARGAAMLAGVGVGLFPTPSAAAGMSRLGRVFDPRLAGSEREGARRRWEEAVNRARSRKTG